MVVLIGASSSLGKAILPQLLLKYEVIGTTRSADKLADLKCPSLTIEELDLQDEHSVDEFCTKLGKVSGKIVLVNMAGLSIDSLFIRYSKDDWASTFDVNINGSIKIIQTALMQMMRAQWGRIINVSSIVARDCVVGASAYAASKAALQAMTNTIAHEYGGLGITANSISLGYMDLGLSNEFDEIRKKNILEKIPSKKFGQSEELIHAIEFLTKSSYTNGSILTIDGGIQ